MTAAVSECWPSSTTAPAGTWALIADTSISGARIARELTAPIAEYGKPKMIVSDNGSEVTSNAILAWADKAAPVDQVGQLWVIRDRDHNSVLNWR